MQLIYPDKITPVSFSPETREEFVSDLAKQEFDICVIGGGITGVGIAWHAALAGLRVALLEKADFAAGTSSKSSKLIHGGFRYLQNYQFRLVHEALTERYILLHLAPHLVSPLPSILPIFKGARFKPWQIKAGMLLYEWLSGFKRVGKHHMMDSQELLKHVPFFRADQLHAGAYYFDAKADDFRLLLATLQNAVLHGCRAVNYVEVVGGEIVSGELRALHAVDKLSGKSIEVKARAFVNASGPWTDHVLKRVKAAESPFLRPTMGIHILVPRKVLPLNEALMVLSVVDNRPLFAVPWNNVVLLGTTDTDFEGNPDLLWASREDVQYLLDSFNGYFSKLRLTEDDVISSFAGLRPLIREEEEEPAKITREHKIVEFPRNLFNIFGGKLTTYRRMAADLMAYIRSRRPDLSIPRRVPTDRIPLYGSEVENYPEWASQKKMEIANQYRLDPDIVDHLLDFYGSHVDEVLKLLSENESLAGRIVPDLPYIFAQLYYSIDHEMTVALDDFFIRRTHILSLDWDQGRSICRDIAELMARHLHWDDQEKEAQIERYLAKVALTRKFRGEKTV